MQTKTIAAAFMFLLAALPAAQSALAQNAFTPSTFGHAANSDNPAALDVQILSLLTAKKFNELDALVTKIEQAYEADRLKERDVDNAFETFRRPHPRYEPLLTAWIAAKPQSAVAYMARGVHYTEVGWAKRGTASIAQTSEVRVDNMSEAFDKAMGDFEKVRSLNPKMVHPLLFEIEILMNFNVKERIRKLYEEALVINPLSQTARWYYTTTLLPRWGGSQAEISAVNEEAFALRQKNPALLAIRGRWFAEEGDQAMGAREFSDAANSYRMALMMFDHPIYNAQLGELLVRTQQYAEAKKSLNHALELRPNYPRVRFFLAMNEYHASHFDEAVKLFTAVIAENPFDHKSLDMRGECYKQQGAVKLALADFEEAIKLDPANEEYLEDRKQILPLVKGGQKQK